jgi:hypothetical protein
MASITTALKVPKSPEELMEELLSESISSLEKAGIPQRVLNTLEDMGVKNIQDLLNCCQHPPEQCHLEGGPSAQCHCVRMFPEGSEERKKWVPKLYLREVPGFADVTIERILSSVRKKIASISGRK